MRSFQWGHVTKYEDIPKWLMRLMPCTTNLDALDKENQLDHIRYRVQHEIDIAQEEGLEETGMSRAEYQNAIKFMQATGGLLK